MTGITKLTSILAVIALVGGVSSAEDTTAEKFQAYMLEH